MFMQLERWVAGEAGRNMRDLNAHMMSDLNRAIRDMVNTIGSDS